MADDPDPDRRGFLKLTTCAIGGGIGLVAVGPVLRFVTAPAGDITVTAPTEPLDVGELSRFAIGAEPTKIDLVAPVVKDAWVAAQNVVLGAAWVRRTAADKVEALSALCPHLGCAVGWDPAGKSFLCPCHESRFGLTGDPMSGPAKRGLDPLPVAIKDGRLQLTWVRYKLDTASRDPA